jgi:hypothetical protein
MKHKWHKEIKAWADGAEIEYLNLEGNWMEIDDPLWHDACEYRIKPQPKEPQYLYVYGDEGGLNFSQWHTEFNNSTPYIGKIKLEE